MLLTAGVPLVESFQIIKNVSPLTNYDKVIEGLSMGESLGKVLQNDFPALMISSLEEAGKIGNLEEALSRLAKYYEDQAETEAKIKTRLTPYFPDK